MIPDKWVTAHDMNTALGNKPGSSGFRTLLGRFRILNDYPYSRDGHRGGARYNETAILEWNAKREGQGNRTPGWHGIRKEASNV